MTNKIKIVGFVFCIVGVFLYNIDRFFVLEASYRICFSITGLSFSFAGLALYLFGIKNRVRKKIRVCPHCFFKNDSSNLSCVKCRTSLV